MAARRILSSTSPTSTDTNVLLNVATTAASGVTAQLAGTPDQPWYDIGFSVAGIAMAFGGLKKPRPGRPRQKLARLTILGLLLSGFVACGGGGSSGGGGAGSPGTPPGTYTITINAVVGSVTRTTQVVLTVK